MLATVPRRTNALGTETYNAHDVHAMLRAQLEKGTADLREWEELLIAQSEAREKTIALAKKCLEEEQGQLDELAAALQKIWDLQLDNMRMRHFETEPEMVAPPTPEDAYMHDEYLSICDETSASSAN